MNTWQAFARLLKPLDPYPEFQRRRFTNRAEREKMMASVDRDVHRERKDRLDWFTNQFLEASFRAIPRDVRRRRTRRDLTIDQTPISVHSGRGHSKRDSRTKRETKDVDVLEPEADWYRVPPKFGGKNGKESDFIHGFAGNTAVLTSFFDHGDGPLPNIVMAFSLSRPRKNTDIETVRLGKSLVDRGHEPGIVAADRDYWAHMRIERLHVPMRLMGWQVLTDYRKDQLGIQPGHGGSILVEGNHMCPGTPAHLLTTAEDASKKLITEETFLKRIEERRSFQLRNKEKPDANGHVKKMCPAHGPQAKIECPLRAIHPNASKKTKPRVRDLDVPEDPDKICTQHSVTFEPKHYLKFEQPLEYGSPEWQRAYKATRNTSEGFHGFAKDTAYEDISNPGRRRARGMGAQQVLMTFLLFGSNLRKIQSFMKQERKNEAKPATPATRRRRDATGRSKYRRDWFGPVDKVLDFEQLEQLAETEPPPPRK